MEEELNTYELAEGQFVDLYKEIDALKQRVKMLEEVVTKSDEFKNRVNILEKLVTANASDINDLKIEKEKEEKEEMK